MRCPFCASDGTQVKDSRPIEEDQSIRRRRQCGSCGGRFTTFERVELRELTVIKSNGEDQPFDRDKVTRSIRVACRKRPVSMAQIDRMVTGVVRQLESQGEPEVSSDTVGRVVMEALKGIDPVAYIRFASVYRNFTEASDFEEFAAQIDEIRAKD